jgi:hypothetical protein
MIKKVFIVFDRSSVVSLFCDIKLGCFRIVIKIRLKIKFDRFSIVKKSNSIFKKTYKSLKRNTLA